MEHPIDEKCEGCGRTRRDGWLLVFGLCIDCGPEGFHRRASILWQQARELLES